MRQDTPSCVTDCFPEDFNLHCDLDLKLEDSNQKLPQNNLVRDDAPLYPVSNLPFWSKVLERIILSQLKEHPNLNNLLSPLQSAYRPNHSTETALLKIFNGILTALDNNKISILTLLDLSAAFDTIVNRSHNCFD